VAWRNPDQVTIFSGRGRAPLVAKTWVIKNEEKRKLNISILVA
jgi:hypothetical protein